MDENREYNEEMVDEEAVGPKDEAANHPADPEPVSEEVRKKANKYFFSKVTINALLMILGAVFIAFFLAQMQKGEE